MFKYYWYIAFESHANYMFNKTKKWKGTADSCMQLDLEETKEKNYIKTLPIFNTKT